VAENLMYKECANIRLQGTTPEQKHSLGKGFLGQQYFIRSHMEDKGRHEKQIHIPI